MRYPPKANASKCRERILFLWRGKIGLFVDDMTAPLVGLGMQFGHGPPIEFEHSIQSALLSCSITLP